MRLHQGMSPRVHEDGKPLNSLGFLVRARNLLKFYTSRSLEEASHDEAAGGELRVSA